MDSLSGKALFHDLLASFLKGGGEGVEGVGRGGGVCVVVVVVKVFPDSHFGVFTKKTLCWILKSFGQGY